MSWDRALLTWVNRGLAHPFLDGLMAAIAIVALPLIALLPLVLLRALLPADRKRAGKALLAVLILSMLMAVGVQYLLDRPRPEGVRLVLPMPAFPSFPSGHAAGVFGYALFATLARRRANVMAWLGAIAVSLSRIYLGHHYPSDVLGGAILGLATGAVVYGVFYRRGEAVRPRWAWLLWGQIAVVLIATLSASLGLLNLRVLALPGADKALHFLLFGLLAFTAVGWWVGRPAGEILIVLGVLVVIEELLQSLSVMRSSDPLDLAATLSGVMLFGWMGERRRH